MDIREEDLKLLEAMIDVFETEMDCDGYDIERLSDAPYHFIIEDIEDMGWDYVHGAKRFIEYFFATSSEKDGKYVSDHSISVRAQFTEVETSLLDIKFVVEECIG